MEHLDAVIFDLDGVITDTASLHTAAWERAFNDFLRARVGKGSAASKPFDPNRDYRLLVDGRPGFDGAQPVMAPRGFELPPGSVADPAGYETVWAVANLKNDMFRGLIRQHGVVGR